MNRILLTIALILFTPLSFGHDAPPVPDPVGLDQLLQAFGWDMETAEITVQSINDNFHVLFGLGGNIAVSVGDDGVLIVDDQFPQLMPKIKKAIKNLGGEGVDFAINTHWHFDHAEGNISLGPEGTWLVSQANSRQMMQQDHIINLVSFAYEQKAYPESAWPDITYDDTMQFHFNGEQIDLMHFGPAHTTGDTAIIFRKSNAVHLGDVYNNSGYPFIDAGNGGSLDGVIEFCSATLDAIDENTVVIPGHGPIADYEALVEYVEMLTTIRSRMMALIEKGATLEEVYAAKVTSEWDEKNGDNTGFINRAYMSLTHRVVDR
ncbi:MAG: MBL fold metallo-hydrolase [Proteobacteria bacterium]|nr:MBL fold metallo-hydrolase [Pseudomonadota bacterium]